MMVAVYNPGGEALCKDGFVVYTVNKDKLCGNFKIVSRCKVRATVVLPTQDVEHPRRRGRLDQADQPPLH